MKQIVSHASSAIARLLLMTKGRSVEAALLTSHVLLMAASILIARGMGPVGRGTIAEIMVFGQLCGWLLTFSLDKAFLISAREGAAASQHTFVFATLLSYYFRVLPLAACLGLLTGWLVTSRPSAIVAVAIVASATMWSELCGAWLFRSHAAHFFVFRIGQPLLYFLFAVVVLVVWEDPAVRLGVFILLVGLASVMTPAVITAAGWLPRPCSSVDWSLVRRLFRVARSTELAILIQYFNARLDLLYLGAFGDAEVLGLYAVGAAVGQLPALFGPAILLRGVGQRSRGTDWVSLASVFVMGCLVWLAAPLVIPWLFGARFSESVSVARVLLVGSGLNVWLLMYVGQLMGASRSIQAAWAQGLGVVTFAVGIAVSSSSIGVAWASVFSYLVALCAAVALSRNRQS